MLKQWIFWRSIQIVIDFFLIYIAFLGAYFLRVGFIFSSDFPLIPYATIALFTSLLWIGFLLVTKYYRIPPRSNKRIIFDFLLIILGGVIAVSTVILLYFFNQELFFSRLINIYALLLGTIFLWITQGIFRKILASQKNSEKNVYQTLIIGANPVAENLIKALNENKYAPYFVKGVIDPYGIHKKIKGSQIIGKLNKLESFCKSEKITAIIQCDAFEHTLNIISFSEEHHIQFQFDPALRGIYEKNLRIREIAGQTMISFVKRDFESKNKRLLYKIADKILNQVFDID